jgi:hypothetical protein
MTWSAWLSVPSLAAATDSGTGGVHRFTPRWSRPGRPPANRPIEENAMTVNPWKTAGASPGGTSMVPPVGGETAASRQRLGQRLSAEAYGWRVNREGSNTSPAWTSVELTAPDQPVLVPAGTPAAVGA